MQRRIEILPDYAVTIKLVFLILITLFSNLKYNNKRAHKILVALTRAHRVSIYYFLLLLPYHF